MEESSLISKLESSNSRGVHSLFTDYLQPFYDLTNPKKTKRSTKAKDDQKTLTRSLAKKFLPFLNRALGILPKRLADRTKFSSDGDGEQLALEFFDIYRLCLDCLGSVSSQLLCKPYSVHVQRVRMVHCLEAWGRWKDAEAECFWVLERFKEIGLGAKSVKCDPNCLLPNAEMGGDDKEFGSLVVEIAVTLVKCVSMSQSKYGDDYRSVIRLVDELRPWFRVLDANTYEKLHRVLVTFLGRCAIFVVGEPTFADEDFARLFCLTTMAEHIKSSNKDDIYKFARRMCSSLFSLQDDRATFIIDMIICVLDSVAREGKVGLENNGIEFIELVAYCANKCQAIGPNCCSTIGAHLNKIAEDQVKTPFHLILRLYATGLLFMNCKLKFKCKDISSAGDVVRTLCAGDVLQNFSALLCSLRSCFHNGCKQNSASSSIDYRDFVCRQCSPCNSHNEASMDWTHKDGAAYVLSYSTALKFTCLPLAELVNSEKKQIITEGVAVAVSSRLSYIQEAFYQFCDVFFFCKRFKPTYEGEKDGFDENSILGIAVALFIVSISTKLNIKKSAHLLNDVISSEWIQPYGLKHLFTSLYNIGVILYRNERLEETLKALTLSCRASWACVLRLCNMFLHKQDGSNDDVSEDAIINFVNESCTRSAFLLNVLHQCDSPEVKRIIVESLENWSVAADLFSRLPSPMSLVKQWVKTRCTSHKNVDVQDTVSTLYSVLSSSENMSKRTIGIILEQELLAYEEVNALHPVLCHKMQMQIIGYLLEDVYVTPESWLQRSRILVRKGRTLKFYGHCLKECIQCLSDAIFSLVLKQKAMFGEPCSFGIQPCHQLAVAYCMRAFCTQESEPNSKQVFQDIEMALKLWLSITTDCFAADDECFMVFENIIILLYNIIDFLSLKGCVNFHYDIYRLMFKLFQWKSVPLEKFLAVLWECRRLTHALCVSPVNEAFLMSLADHCDRHSKSIDFWISCLKASHPLLVGFEHNFSFLFANIPQDSFNCGSSFRTDITVDEVKDVAFELISSVPASNSASVAAYLFFDLSERLISNGRITEALYYAKQAHRLRSKMFEEKFKFSVEQQPKKSNETGDVQKFTCSFQDLHVRRSAANEFWSFDTISLDLERGYLSPWIILQCYLESTLQVGIAHELIGNGAEAEGYFLWGKSISCSQNLPLFMVSFSSVLGNLYCKKHLWDLAKRELHSAKQYLEAGGGEISCLKCRMLLEITVSRHLGDLSHSIIDNSSGRTSIESSSHVEVLYKAALDKLNHSNWETCASFPEAACAWSIVLNKTHVKDVDHGASNAFVGTEESQQDTKKSSRRGSKVNNEVKKCRKTRNASKALEMEQDSIPDNNFKTCSKNWPSQSQIISSDLEDGNLKCLDGNGENECSGIISQRDMLLEIKSCKVAFGHAGACICNKMRCWHCLQVEVVKNGQLNSLIDMKWEFVRRRLLLNLLTGLGNCLENCGQIHEAHKFFIHSMLILVNQDSFHLTPSHVPLGHLLNIVGKEIPGNMFIVERAEILYSISWFSLKGYHSRDKRLSCCDMYHIQPPQLVAWLMHMFIMCREVPMLLQKVSRLLAVMFLVAASGDLCSVSSSCKALSENHWASFFHQASLGTHLNYQFCTNHNRMHNVQCLADSVDFCRTGSTCLEAEIRNLLRLVPKSIHDLEEFVENFFAGFPCTTAICISLLGGPYSYLLQELLGIPLHVRAWMLVSRLDFESQPIVVLLPVDSISEEAPDDATNSAFYSSESKNLGKHWECPWGSTIMDDVATEFKLILEENYLSSSMFPSENTKETTRLWWTSRKKLDHRLGEFLRNLEDSWLGPWKYILLGERSNCKSLDSVYKKLARSLKSKCKMDVSKSLLKVILGAPTNAFEGEEFVLQLCFRKSCYVGRIEGCEKDRQCPSSDTSGVELSGLALQLIREAVNELEGEGYMGREPIMLVLDFDVQMLPWENIPILRNQEVYRMPSIWSISSRLDRSYHNQEQTRTFSFIDPLDAFYLLNPGGDLGSTQIEFENWFRDQNFEGEAGHAPTAEELAEALKSHDLFLYFGHGSGTQYIPRHEIQKLEKCAAALLMGCSSGSLTLNGCYAPNGAPLSYLLAGSPVIVANLWEVTDKDIDRFGKAVLDACFKERFSSSTDCAKCSLVAELEALSLKGRKGNAKKKVQRKKLPEACEKELVVNRCVHRPMIGSFVGQAREACILPYLIGASPVCYGVPTGIRNKKDL